MTTTGRSDQWACGALDRPCPTRSHRLPRRLLIDSLFSSLTPGASANAVDCGPELRNAPLRGTHRTAAASEDAFTIYLDRR